MSKKTYSARTEALKLRRAGNPLAERFARDKKATADLSTDLQRVLVKTDSAADDALLRATDALAANPRMTDAQFATYRADLKVYSDMRDLADKLRPTVKAISKRAKIERVSEGQTYGPLSDRRHSYFMDLATVHTAPIGAPVTPQLREAQERMRRHSIDVQSYPRRYRESCLLEARGREYRAPMTTAPGVGGDLVTPVWLVEQAALYRPTLSSVHKCLNAQPLPDYGMTIQIPKLTSASGVATHVDNTNVQETDPATGFLASGSAPFFTANLSAVAGQVLVSAQAFERGGNDAVAFDEIVYRQLAKDLDEQQDALAITALLTSLASTTTDSSAITPTLAWNDIATAKQSIATKAGVHRIASHLFVSSTFAGWIQSLVDDSHRPLFLPDDVNAAKDPLTENTGFLLQNLQMWIDDNLPLTSGQPTLLVTYPTDCLAFEGTPIPTVFEQPEAESLSYLISLRSYVCYVPLRASSAAITGSAYSGLSG